MPVNVSTPASLAPRWWVRLWAWLIPPAPLPAESADPEGAGGQGPVPGWLQDIEDQHCGVAYLNLLGKPAKLRVRPFMPMEMIASGRMLQELHEAFGAHLPRDPQDDMALAAADAAAAAGAEEAQETPEQRQQKKMQWLIDVARRQVTHIQEPDTGAWRRLAFVDEPGGLAIGTDGAVRLPIAYLTLVDLTVIVQAARRPLREVAGMFGPFLRQ